MSTHADSLAVRPTIRLPMAVVCTAAIATINFKIVAALPDLPKSESFQDILVGTTAGLVVATALGRLFFGCSFRRALSALLGGVALGWIGGIAVLPVGVLAFVEGRENFWSWRNRPEAPFLEHIIAWCIAIGLPLLVALALRRRTAWVNAVAAVWVLVIGTFHSPNQDASRSLPLYAWNSLGPYFWAGIGALGFVVWGLLERRKERINLGVAGFALTVIIFYFSDVMDKLGRSASLIGLGVLFLFGGWGLERMRRQLVARVAGGAQ